MFRGLYTLTSGMMTQQTNLNTISNNMANSATTGYKSDKMVSTTFQQVLLSRTGNRAQSASSPLGEVSMIRVADGTKINYEQGQLENTKRDYDFAISGNGFFEIQAPDGAAYYTRNGSFTVDDAGNLFLQNVGRVVGEQGPISLVGSKFTVDADGSIRMEDGAVADKIRVVDFVDYEQLQKTGEGMFTNANAGNIQDSQADVMWKWLERSNVQAMDEMVAMMSSQRALQSASQMIKIYDGMMNKAANDIGRI